MADNETDVIIRISRFHGQVSLKDLFDKPDSLEGEK